AIRVSELTLDSLALQIEEMTMTVARQERRTRELRAFGAKAAEVLQLCEKSLGELKSWSGDAKGVGPLEEGASRLRSLRRDVMQMARDSATEIEHLQLTSTLVRNDLRDLRMVPASTVLDPLRRTVREMSSRLEKDVELKVNGGDIRLDRRILDELRDPLQH